VSDGIVTRTEFRTKRRHATVRLEKEHVGLTNGISASRGQYRHYTAGSPLTEAPEEVLAEVLAELLREALGEFQAEL